MKDKLILAPRIILLEDDGLSMVFRNGAHKKIDYDQILNIQQMVIDQRFREQNRLKISEIRIEDETCILLQVANHPVVELHTFRTGLNTERWYEEIKKHMN